MIQQPDASPIDPHTVSTHSKSTRAATIDSIQPQRFKRVRARATRNGSMRTESMRTGVRIRDFTYAVDEPTATGGTNTAPTPMEYLAGAVNSCITVVIETIANELDIGLQHVHTETVAHMDPRGFNGVADISPHFHDYTLHVWVACDASDDQRRVLAEQTERRCPAFNLLCDTGLPVELQWQFSATPA